eukprot:sb/3462240/
MATTVRGFGRGRSKKKINPDAAPLFTSGPPPLVSCISQPPPLTSGPPPLTRSSNGYHSNNGYHGNNIDTQNGANSFNSFNNSFGDDSNNHYQRGSNGTTNCFSDPNGGDNELVMHIQDSFIPRIIGRGGVTINKIREETGTQIDVEKGDRGGGGTKAVTISGDPDSIAAAKAQIEEITSGGGERRSGFQFGGGGGNSKTISIQATHVGRLIGSGGCNVRRIREESGVEIDVDRDGNSYDFDKKIELRGTPEAIAKAIDLIRESANILDEGNGDGGAPAAVEDGGIIDWGRLAERQQQFAQEKWGSMPPVEKQFYQESPEIARLSPGEVAQIRADNMAIEVAHYDQTRSHLPIPKPVLTFEHAFSRYPDILREIAKQGFKVPSPIQKQMWPILLSGHDCIGVAQTGTGKTLAFLLPAFIHIEAQAVPRSERAGPTVFVLAPTRELALQIKWEVDKYTYHGIKSACVYGGGSRSEQITEVKKGVDIVVATPGRLNDLLESKILNLDSCSYLILDEADRMLDMGFEPQIKTTLLDIRPDRHTVMTSATWPPGVRRIANEYMTNSIIVNVGTLDLKAAATVTQHVIMCDKDEKMEILQDLIETKLDHHHDKCLVFVGRKATADFISSEFITRYMQDEFRGSNIRSDAIHGDRDQCDREAALRGFKEGDISVLIATDVASRGLDVRGITHVINYDFPRDMEDYVHRVGRTGRAGKEGTAVSLFTREDWRKSTELIKILTDSNQLVPDELYPMSERWEKKKAQLDREKREGRGGDRERRGPGMGGGGNSRQRYR